jgi:hypothetical protein
VHAPLPGKFADNSAVTGKNTMLRRSAKRGQQNNNFVILILAPSVFQARICGMTACSRKWIRLS